MWPAPDMHYLAQEWEQQRGPQKQPLAPGAGAGGKTMGTSSASTAVAGA